MKYPGENYDKPWTEEGDFGPVRNIFIVRKYNKHTWGFSQV